MNGESLFAIFRRMILWQLALKRPQAEWRLSADQWIGIAAGGRAGARMRESPGFHGQ